MLCDTLFTIFNITAVLSFIVFRGKNAQEFFNAVSMYVFILAFGLLGQHRPPAIVMFLALPTLLCMEAGATSSS